VTKTTRAINYDKNGSKKFITHMT